MYRMVVPGALALALAGCQPANVPDYSNTPSPLYGGVAPCPGSATSASGGPATPYDCVPGGREGGGGRPRGSR